MKHEEINFQDTQFTQTMMPGKIAKSMRTCVLWQLFRFAVLNIKMIIVVRKSH
jgi:hypothetical protein